jgi:hypothetical protein
MMQMANVGRIHHAVHGGVGVCAFRRSVAAGVVSDVRLGAETVAAGDEFCGCAGHHVRYFQSSHAIGATAIELLLEATADTDHAPRNVVFQPELVVRASSG